MPLMSRRRDSHDLSSAAGEYLLALRVRLEELGRERLRALVGLQDAAHRQ